MDSTPNMLTDLDLLNNDNTLLNSMFKEHGWYLVKNEMNWICYTKNSQETDFFEMKVINNSIHVSVPLKNSSFNYITTFNDYLIAVEYMESKLLNFYIS